MTRKAAAGVASGVPICQDAACAGGGDRTIYVHLDNGGIKEVTGVRRLYLTRESLVLEHRDGSESLFARECVYFACCGHHSPPSLT